MNGWARIPKTLRAEVQVGNYLRQLGRSPFSYTTIRRLARHIELLGERPGSHIWIYDVLYALDPSLADLSSEVSAELSLRQSKREREAEREAERTRLIPTHRLLADGSLEKIGA